MECALRIIALCHALDMVRDALDESSPVWSAVLALVRDHAGIIARRVSRHSSAGNHTIAESVGLIYAGAYFPEFPRASNWLETGTAVLGAEAQRQVLPDGGGIERATWYHRFVVELTGLAAQALNATRNTVPADISAAYERGRRFLNALASGPDQLALLGDADSGYALSEYLDMVWSGDSGDEPPCRTFPDTGITRIAPASEHSLGLIFDHGDLGMAPLYGHGHADALSVVMTLGEQPVFIDPGTYTYGRHPAWRRYFRGTPAHNTVTVDGLDQARQRTNFIWSEPYGAKLIAQQGQVDGIFVLVGRHDGYRTIGVTHVRGICMLGPRQIVVLDRLLGTGEHELALHWHCAARAETDEDTSFLSLRDGTVGISMAGGERHLFHGSKEPRLGWRSPGYGKLEPATTLVCAVKATLPHDFVTVVWAGAQRPGEHSIQQASDMLQQWMN